MLITTTAAAPSLIVDAFPAVTVPPSRNAPRNLASVSAVVSGRMPSSRRSQVLSPLRAGISTGDDLVVENPGVPGFCGQLVRAGRERVLVLAGDDVDVVARLGEQAHRLIGECVVQAVEGHVVDEGDVAVLVTAAGTGQKVRGLTHRLHAAGDDDVERAGRG